MSMFIEFFRGFGIHEDVAINPAHVVRVQPAFPPVQHPHEKGVSVDRCWLTLVSPNDVGSYEQLVHGDFNTVVRRLMGLGDF